jgi:signal transduction histidine kinase
MTTPLDSANKTHADANSSADADEGRADADEGRADALPLRRLLEVGRTLVCDLDTDGILRRVLEAAREVTGARYAALAVFDAKRQELSRFLTSGIDQATYDAIGELPKGRGVLGVLIEDPRPLRLRDVREHPRSYGFPPGHPEMHSFLGVPILIRGEPWGRLYLTEKQGGDEFTAADEEAAVILSEYAGVAVENARLYEHSERQRKRLERAVRSLEATRDIAIAIGDVTELERVLELIAERGRALVAARTVLIMLREGEDLVVAARAGQPVGARGLRLPIASSTPGQVLARGRPQRIADVSSHPRLVPPEELELGDVRTALVVPMLYRGVGVGVMAAFDHDGEPEEPFTEADEDLMLMFAAQAASGVALAQSVEASRLRAAMSAADAERRRWARELHDETLQIFGGLRVLLSGVLRRGERDRYEAAIREAVEGIEQGIDGLRAIISDLRPTALDDLGLKAALETLIERARRSGLAITAELRLPEDRRKGGELGSELETAVYRIVQELLTNVIKHARAEAVRVRVRASEASVDIEVQDDGVGFDVAERTDGFGLAGLRERVYLLGGAVAINSGADGTLVRASLPVSRAGPASAMPALAWPSAH